MLRGFGRSSWPAEGCFSASGDEDLAWVEWGLATWISQILDGVRGIELVAAEDLSKALDNRGLDQLPLPAEVGRELAMALGTQVVLEAILERDGQSVRLEATTRSLGGDTFRHEVRAADSTAAAQKLGSSHLRRLGLRAEGVEVRDLLSPDDLSNQAFAVGVQVLRSEGPRPSRPNPASSQQRAKPLSRSWLGRESRMPPSWKRMSS